eukprot:5908637-Amphidinium_carterae.1
MTLQAEGIQLLGEKAWTGSASFVQHADVDHSSCNHDSASTQAPQLAAEHLQRGQQNGADVAVAFAADVAVAFAARACAHVGPTAAEPAERVAEHLQPMQWRGAD